MGSWNMGEGSGLPKVGAEISLSDNNNHTKGGDVDLYTQLWLACAGPLVNVPRTGDKIYYFPQGHIEQVDAYMNQDVNVEMPIYCLPSKILCKVVYIHLKAEANTDEVFAQITLLPEVKLEEPSVEEAASLSSPQKSHASCFCKRLTPSDTSTHGGLSIPKRYADECLPPLDMSHNPPSQELAVKDLHGSEWRFRHIYRGQPRRHLLTSGWSTFVGAKKLVAGDACIFLRGENGELYVGVRHATRSQNTGSASVLSCLSMQHGILATAFHAISTGSMFTVYYRPWTGSAEFIIPCDQYMKSAEIDYSVGTRFTMQFEREECPDHRCQKDIITRFAGTVVGVEDIDCIRWPGSEWRHLKVRWDAISDAPVLPERVSPWRIEPIGITKKKRLSVPPHPKRARPSESSTPEFPFMVKDGLLKSTVEYMHQIHSGVLQGQEIGAVDGHEWDASAQLTSPRITLQSNPGWAHMKVGLENQLPLEMCDPFYHSPGSTLSFPGGNPPNSVLANFCNNPAFASCGNHDSIAASKSLPVPSVNFVSSVSQESNTFEKKDEREAPQAQPNGGKYMLFGVNIFDSRLKLPLPQVVSSSELSSLCSVPPMVSQSSISETIHISDPCKSISGNLLEKECKNYCSVTNRSCTKVLKYGTALGRSVDLTRFDGYKELISELDQMFDFKGTLIAGISGWHITYTDPDGDMLLLGDCPWQEFRAMVRKMFICPREDVDKVDPRSLN